MSEVHPLYHFFSNAVQRFPDSTALVEPGVVSLTYTELDNFSDLIRDSLRSHGVGTRDRVGIVMKKSANTVAAIYGVLKAGAAYVPVDASAPSARNAYIMQNCGVKAILIEQRLVDTFVAAADPAHPLPVLLTIETAESSRRVTVAAPAASSNTTPAAAAEGEPGADDLAYILYTSGSTGKPKGVMLSHENAVTFVDWCSEVFDPQPTDRFSSHAPFHFDLSILDLYVPLKHGATLVLVPDEIGKDPVRLPQLIADEKITCWYSAPSILSLMAQFGKLDNYDLSQLRYILFAGEVFPVRHLRTLTELLPMARYFNLYGPTETNVCTWYEVPLPVPAERTDPFPIGEVCSHLAGKVVDEAGNTVSTGDEGELVIAGRGGQGPGAH